MYASIILTVCVLSIVVTAPTGAILITLTGSKLLSKTKQPPNLEGKGKKMEWREFYNYSLILFLRLAKEPSAIAA